MAFSQIIGTTLRFVIAFLSYEKNHSLSGLSVRSTKSLVRIASPESSKKVLVIDNNEQKDGHRQIGKSVVYSSVVLFSGFQLGERSETNSREQSAMADFRDCFAT